MPNLQRDSIVNTINQGIRRDIEVALANNCLRAAIILIFSGIDAMTYLDLPENETDVTRGHFIRWCDRYIRFPCQEQLTGADLYGARCSMLHTYGAVSRLSRAGKCRKVGYMDKSVPEIRANKAIDPTLVLVSVPGLRDAFFAGMDRFLVDAFADKKKAPVVESRIQTFVHAFPTKGKIKRVAPQHNAE